MKVESHLLSGAHLGLISSCLQNKRLPRPHQSLRTRVRGTASIHQFSTMVPARLCLFMIRSTSGSFKSPSVWLGPDGFLQRWEYVCTPLTNRVPQWEQHSAHTRVEIYTPGLPGAEKNPYWRMPPAELCPCFIWKLFTRNVHSLFWWMMELY